jgi:hypothetical protein
MVSALISCTYFEGRWKAQPISTSTDNGPRYGDAASERVLAGSDFVELRTFSSARSSSDIDGTENAEKALDVV